MSRTARRVRLGAAAAINTKLSPAHAARTTNAVRANIVAAGYG